MGNPARPERTTMIVAAAPILCAIHCAAGPLLVVAAPALAPTAVVEWALFGVTSAVVAGLSVRRGVCWREWGSWLMAAGAMVWVASLAGWLEPFPEALTTGIGTVALAGGLLRTARVGRRPACGCRGCSEEEASDGAASGWSDGAASARAP